MGKKIKQIRFPETIINSWDRADWSYNLLENLGYVTQLGIYALPGSEFKISQKNQAVEEKLVINGSGIFSIDVKDKPIGSLKIRKNDYEKIEDGSHFIIIDLIYEDGVI